MDISQRPDAALVKAALAGDREAFSILVRRHQDYAYGVAVGLLSDFELARDVVQEAFLCAYRDLPRLKSPARFGGWLRGIVRHTAHRALRELARVRSMAEELRRTVEPFARTVLPDRSAEEAERRETVRRALERLNDRNREAVSLYYVDGFSYAEIAEFLGVTKATVQGRLPRPQPVAKGTEDGRRDLQRTRTAHRLLG
ncbi:MAG: RNA polymerase sigma factor [Candidatus Brocadiae bacterium]|nr:RNA polymerase sigma factor [Candidatus Brocadiia bacterium]